MSLADDIFAFVDTEPIVKKRKKDKKKGKSKDKNHKKVKTESIDTNNSYDGGVDSVIDLDKDEDTDVGKEDEYKEENMKELSELLGLSTDTTYTNFKSGTPILMSETSNKSEDGTNNEDFKGFNNREQNNGLTEEEGTGGGEDEAEEEENNEFLKSLSKDMNDIRAKANEYNEIISSHKSTEFTINGETIKAKDIKFHVNLQIYYKNYTSDLFQLELKSTTQVKRAINKLFTAYNSIQGNEEIPEKDWYKYVIYIDELNTYIDQDLKFSSLLCYQSQLKTEIIKGSIGFSINGIIIEEDKANDIIERKNNEKSLNNDKNNKDSENLLIEINVLDKILNTEIKFNVINNISFNELISIYKYKTKLPQSLNISISSEKNTNSISLDNCLNELNVLNNDKFIISYNKDEYNELIEEFKNDNKDEEEEDEIEDFKEIVNDDSNEETGKPNELIDDKDNEYFKIFLVGEDNNKVQVRVKSSTKIEDIVEFYKNKVNLDNSVKIKLLFDDDELPEDGFVRDTELEEDFIIEVVRI